MKRNILIILIFAVIVASNLGAYFYLVYSHPQIVNISEVNHEVLFSGTQAASPSDAFFSATTRSSGFSVGLGGTFNDTISFHSVPSLTTFDVIDISVESSTSSSFSIVTMNATLPLKISSNQSDVSILLRIRVPD